MQTSDLGIAWLIPVAGIYDTVRVRVSLLIACSHVAKDRSEIVLHQAVPQNSGRYPASLPHHFVEGSVNVARYTTRAYALMPQRDDLVSVGAGII